MAKNALLFLFLLVNISAFSQYRVSGSLHSPAGDPIQGADILFNGTFGTSDAKGLFVFENIPSGQYGLEVYTDNFRHYSTAVTVGQEDVTLDITLQPLEETLDTTVVVVPKNDDGFNHHLKAVEGTSLNAGRKTDVVNLDETQTNKATNNARQTYSHTSLNVWESDEAGLQLGLGGRGLSPNRTSNFNTRQNGYDMSADALGYPESYYTPTLEGVDRIEIIRGAAVLQYGTQFGGMVNFVMKEGPADRKAQIESRQTVGSFGFFNSFNSVGGTVGKLNYYTYFNYKRGDGWRENGGFDYKSFYAGFRHQTTKKLKLSLDFTHMDYLSQQSGGLTDQQFLDDPRQATRDKDFFAVDWNLGAFQIDYEFSNKTKLNIRNFGLYAQRKAVGHLDRDYRIGGDNTTSPRELLHGTYLNFGSEARLLHKYNIKKESAILLFGGRFYRGNTDNKQGHATQNDEPEFEFEDYDQWSGSDFQNPSLNASLFAENLFNLSDKWSVTPGLRFEYIQTNSYGYTNQVYRHQNDNSLISIEDPLYDERNLSRSLLLAGIGISYKPKSKREFYANLARNYRSITFSDLRLSNPNVWIDPNMTDETGFTSDIGARGYINKVFHYDASLFFLKYNDRIGSTWAQPEPGVSPKNFRTNLGDAVSMGVEALMEMNLTQWLAPNAKSKFLAHLDVAYTYARYIHSDIPGVEGSVVELTPPVIIKTGLSYQYRKKFKIAYQYVYTHKHANIPASPQELANETVLAPYATLGMIPTYSVMDLSLAYNYNEHFSIEANCNNLLNRAYFTRRAEGYPGPGIIPSAGRAFYITVAGKF